jgi:ATP-dependent RNA helicase DDX18/HAS1
VNALDLTKVAKAFGFKVPPRVNLAIGPGKGVSSRVGEKRRREEEDTESEEESDGERDNSGQTGDGSVRGPMRGKGDGKARRIETVGQKIVDKEKYRKAKHGSNWSR